MFNHVQLHVHWLHLFNTRICRYTCIYITSTVQTLHYCPAGAWHWNDIVLTSMRRYHVTSTSFWRHVPAGCDQDRRVKSCPTLKMKSTVFSKVYFQQFWLVGCFGLNGPLKQYFSLYRAVSKREGEKEEKRIDESKNVQTTPTRTYYKRSRPLPYCNPNCRTPRHWKLTQHHRTTRPPPYFQQNLDTNDSFSLSAQPDHMWKSWKK